MECSVYFPDSTLYIIDINLSLKSKYRKFLHFPTASHNLVFFMSYWLLPSKIFFLLQPLLWFRCSTSLINFNSICFYFYFINMMPTHNSTATTLLFGGCAPSFSSYLYTLTFNWKLPSSYRTLSPWQQWLNEKWKIRISQWVTCKGGHGSKSDSFFLSFWPDLGSSLEARDWHQPLFQPFWRSMVTGTNTGLQRIAILIH